jgi:hypothetical protein
MSSSETRSPVSLPPRLRSAATRSPAAVTVPAMQRTIVSKLRRGAGPVHPDGAEQSVLDGIPLRAARRIVAHRDGEPAGIPQLFLELGFPHAGPAAVRATRIGQNEQTLGPREAVAPVVGPPITDRLNGKAWCVETVTDAHKTAIAG